MQTKWKENIICIFYEVTFLTAMISTDLTESVLDIAARQYVGLWKVNNSNAKTTV